MIRRELDAGAARMSELSLDFMLQGANQVLAQHGAPTNMGEADSARLVDFLKVEAGKAVSDFIAFCRKQDELSTDSSAVQSYFARRMLEAGIEGAKLYLGLVN